VFIIAEVIFSSTHCMQWPKYWCWRSV